MKAYIWQENYMDTGYVIYAENANKARYKASESSDYGLNIHVKRTPWLDEFYNKEIPAKVMLEHDWWVQCPQCGCECALVNETAYIKSDKAYCISCDAELKFDGDLD